MKRMLVVLLLVLAGCGDQTPEEVARDHLTGIINRATRLHMTDSVRAGSDVDGFPQRMEIMCGGRTCVSARDGVLMEFTEADLEEAAAVTLHPARYGVPNWTGNWSEENKYGSGFNSRTLRGWLRSSAFDVTTAEDGAIDWTWSSGTSVGRESESNPGLRAKSDPVPVSMTWTGLAVAVPVDTPDRTVTGRVDATYSFDQDPTHPFALDTLDVTLSELTEGYAPITWENVPMRDGWFGTEDGSLSGSFYGPNHEEVGGAFERGGLIGAFGAERN